ncbi:HNH endonuclease signature motif containing protein, partial [Streptococcus pyogenes]
ATPGRCWMWRDAKTADGYGQFSLGNRESQTKHRAHVVAYWVFVGPVPKGMLVCHSCDRRACCNPEHLFLGSHQDNMDDMRSK